MKARAKARATKQKISIVNIISVIIALYIIGSFAEVNIHNQISAELLNNPYNAFSLLSQAMSE